MNQHEYIGWTSANPTPRHIIGGELTGWAYSDAVRQITCSHCGSEAGFHCETKSGRKSWPPHGARVGPFMQSSKSKFMIGPSDETNR